MTDAQPYLAIGVPVVVNAAMLTLALTLLRAQISDLKELWRVDLRRVEEVLTPG